MKKKWLILFSLLFASYSYIYSDIDDCDDDEDVACENNSYNG